MPETTRQFKSYFACLGICLVLCVASVAQSPQSLLLGEDSPLPFRPGKAEYWEQVIRVTQDDQVSTTGFWVKYPTYGFRQSFEARDHLHTEEDGATLQRTFESSGLVLVLETHRPYVYPGNLNNGILQVLIDGEVSQVIHPLTEANEIVLFRDKEPQPRNVTLLHRVAENGGRGIRVTGFRELDEPAADLSFYLTAEASDIFIDARISVTDTDGSKTYRTVVQRNWVSGMVRLAGLPPGDNYKLHIEALGWQDVTIPLPPLYPGSERLISPVYLSLDDELITTGFKMPRLGYPAIKRPGDDLELLFEPPAYDKDVTLLALNWKQSIRQAKRTVPLWEGEKVVPEDGLALTIVLPDQPLSGLGDLIAYVQTSKGPAIWRAPQSLHLRDQYPDQPVLLTLGHLDTWGHYQGEYLSVFSEMANIINPDAVLFSNEVHPAYTSGGLKHLNIPYVTTIGNHTFGYEENPSYLDIDGERQPNPEMSFSVSIGRIDQDYYHREPHYDWRNYGNRAFDRWFGNPMGVMELSPEIALLNYGWSWDPKYNLEAIESAKSIFGEYRTRRIKILNAYESEPPHDFINKFDFSLVHSAHAWGRAVAMHSEGRSTVQGHQFKINNGATTFIGKQSSNTYHIVKFDNNRVVARGYGGKPYQPWPLDRHRVAPLRVEFPGGSVPDQSGHYQAHLKNDYTEAFQDCHVHWVLPKGEYAVTGGKLHHYWDSDDGKWTVLIVKADVQPQSMQAITAERISP